MEGWTEGWEVRFRVVKGVGGDDLMGFHLVWLEREREKERDEGDRENENVRAWIRTGQQ